MPTVLLAFGLRFYFYSGEHQPIHVHVEMPTDEPSLCLNQLSN